MLPWGHAAVGYLLYTGWGRWQRTAPPHGVAVIALAIGTQFPDLVDKPFAWTFAVLPTGRSLAHSVLTFALVALVLLAVAWRYDRRDHSGRAAAGTGPVSTLVETELSARAVMVVTAFLIGYGSHLGADTAAGLATGSSEFAYLLYPLLPLGAAEHGHSFLEFFLSLTLTPMIVVEGFLTVVAIGVWLRDGRPGLATACESVEWLIPRVRLEREK